MVNITIKDSQKARFLIAKSGNSLKSFTNSIGCSYSYMSRVIAGKNNPSAIFASRIAKTLDKEIDDLFTVQTSEKQEVK